MDFISTEVAAEYIGVTNKTLEHWRSTGYGPIYYKKKGIIKYERNAINEWISEGRVNPADKEVK